MNRFLFSFSVILLLTISFSNLSSQGVLEWEECAELASPPGIPVAAEANGKLYVLSGTPSVNATTWEYNPANDTWTQKAPIPQGCFWASAVSVNNKIYVMGGGHPYPGQKYNFIYDPIEDTWTRGADLLVGRMYHSAASVGTKIYIIGGQNGDGTTEWYFEEYDTEKDTWTRKTNIPNNLAWYCGAVGDGKYFYRIAGGGAPAGLTRDNVDRYDTEIGIWKEMNNFPIANHAPSVVNFHGQIIVTGGYSLGKYLDSVWTYLPDTDSWESMSLPRLPEPRSYHRAVVINNKIYVYGGQNEEELKGKLIKLVLPVGVQDVPDDNISLTPNPVKNVLYITKTESFSNEIQLVIYNYLGQVVFDSDIDNPGERISLNLQGLNSGFYCLELKSNNKTTRKIFVKD